ncbi:MAG: asparagine synthase-related protein, partial [Campylobacterota bacterium]|nr:asparagine synthase-related protein [Campylobacterota bacterium]
KLIESAFSIKPELRYQNGATKDLLKKVARPYLNESILKRKKRGFANPYMEYLIVSGKIETILHVNKKTGLFKKEALQEYVQRASKGSFKQHVWGLYVLSCWIQKELL